MDVLLDMVFLPDICFQIVSACWTGKTLLAKTLARFVNVPFVIADATTLTQVSNHSSVHGIFFLKRSIYSFFQVSENMSMASIFCFIGGTIFRNSFVQFYTSILYIYPFPCVLYKI